MATANIAAHRGIATQTPVTVLIREVAASGLAAAFAGLIAGGLGGRLVMRISALVNPSLAGALSENGNAIGEITADGTLQLVLFGGLLSGMVAATAWVAIRPWLPGRDRWRYVAAAVAAVGMTGIFVVDGDNFDFAILRPAWLHVMMFTAIVAGAGVLTAWFDTRLVARWRQSRRFTPFALLILLMGVSLVPVSIGSLFSTEMCFCSAPARPLGVFLVATLLATATRWLVRWRGVLPGRRLMMAGTVTAAAAITAGWIHLVGQITAIV